MDKKRYVDGNRVANAVALVEFVLPTQCCPSASSCRPASVSIDQSLSGCISDSSLWPFSAENVLKTN